MTHTTDVLSAPDLPELSWHHAHTWLPLPADQVRTGDVYANHGTVTAVHHGPTLPELGWDTLAADEVRIECGPSYATTGPAGRIVIVGRRIAQEPE